ncbi:MAG TPA: ATP-binding protein [Patescibacteria group bacterium]
MTLPTIIATIGMVVFGILTIYFSLREHLLKKELLLRDETRKRRVYQLSVLKSLQERIGYSLDIERIIDTLTGSLKNLFPYTTASSIVIHEDKYVFKIALEERVSNNFVNQVKKSMLASLASLIDHPLPQHFEEYRTGLIVDDENLSPLASFFHIPLIVKGEIVGLISICSTKPGLYKEEDMTILYQLTTTASNAFSKLQQVISTEQDKLLSMISSLADGILMIDASYKLTLINQAAKTLIGIPHLARPNIFDAVNMLSKQYDFGTKIKECLSMGKIIEEKELNLVDKTVQVIITPVFGPQEEDSGMPTKKVIGATVLIHDITLEKSLQQMKEDFTNAVVHELRSPLTAMKAAAEIMRDNESLAKDVQKLAIIIDEQSKRLLNDINSLLDAAKLEAGHFTIWQAPNDVPKLVEETAELFQPEAEEKNIKINTFFEDALPQAFIDLTRIDQVLNNLISNSLKFTPRDGKIDIKVVSQFNAQLPRTPTNPGILVSVTDTGIGIPEDKQKVLFNKFAQIKHIPGDRKDSEITEGTGLGLYIAKGIVEAHGGNIYVSSTPSHGTTIFFTLPVAKEETKPLLNPKLQKVLEHYTPKVLN